MTLDLRDLIGKPYLEGARGPHAFDCWGVLQEVLRRQGHSPTDYPTNPALLLGAIADEWSEVQPRAATLGDGILLRSADSRVKWHIGVFLANGRMLHAREVAGVCVERYDSLVYARRVVGFYRYRGRLIDSLT